MRARGEDHPVTTPIGAHSVLPAEGFRYPIAGNRRNVVEIQLPHRVPHPDWKWIAIIAEAVHLHLSTWTAKSL